MVDFPFIFSSQTFWRLSRHISFWAFWYLFQVFLYAFTPDPKLSQLSFGMRMLIVAPESLCYMTVHIFLSYALMYWVIPRLVIPGKYIQALIAVIFILFATAMLSATLSMTVVEYMRKGNFSTPRNVQIFMSIIAGLRGGITIGGLAAAIKLMKYFYEKQEMALTLERRQIVAELQLLKSQLHPHFLFNTLNNIYAHTQETAPVASDMLLDLSALLRYTLYACNAAFVPLADEIKMLNAYVELEKKRYGNELDVSVQIVVDTQCMIAPLIMLPFLENCFKHGTSSLLENPWISLTIVTEGSNFQMKLVNGVSESVNAVHGGIGIENVRRRLQLIYPDKHKLRILKEKGIYIVDLEIDLSQNATADNLISSNQPVYEFKNI